LYPKAKQGQQISKEMIPFAMQGSIGQAEIVYEQFLAMAASDQRPLISLMCERVNGAVGA